MTNEEAEKYLTAEDRPKAAVYALTVLLVAKGIITNEEFEVLICDWADRKKALEDKLKAENPLLAALFGEKP